MEQILLLVSIFACGFIVGVKFMHSKVSEGIDYAIDRTVDIFGAAIDKSSLTPKQKEEIVNLVLEGMRKFKED